MSMHLSRLEIQGFKTFAKKTIVDFRGPTKNANALTVVVGPNGSGKSNIADAIRWCLGEQSMKQLRGKKAEDIIFSGSKGKTRSGYAEVIMTLDNSKKTLKIDFSEVNITRRLYRDGETEYLLNGKATRLADVQLLLAEAGIGQRTYTVVAQGMIDHVLTSSPEERKVFFDDATGVRGLQIKRHHSMNKLKNATKNLIEVELILAEIEPRLRILKKQISRLEKREKFEEELKELQEKYYSTQWWDLQNQLTQVKHRLDIVEAQVKEKQADLKAGDDKLMAMEENSKKDAEEDRTGLKNAQAGYKVAQQTLANARHSKFEAERNLELAKVSARSIWAPLPLSSIIKSLDEIISLDPSLGIAKFISFVKKLKDQLTKPNPEDFKPDPKMLEALKVADEHIKLAEMAVKKAEKLIDAESKSSSEVNTELFAVQRKLRGIQHELHRIEQNKNQIQIESARIETRIEGLVTEMLEEIPQTRNAIMAENKAIPDLYPNQTRADILRIKHQLELIGGIDEETIKEHEDTELRFNFLSGQLKDLREAIRGTEKIVDELDERIQKQSEKAFKTINTEFQKYFRILFGGGSCSLIKLRASENSDDPSHVSLDRSMEEMAESEVRANNDDGSDRKDEDESAEDVLVRFKKRRETVSGVDIQATPPGKKLKSLSLLSGGERALTSIALLSAIMATNPSPFVVLDEVDAALDDANTVRFANILDELRKLTQFVVISHNRATMERADLLYGVTMGDDGISNLLSVSMTDLEDVGSARR